MWTKKHTTKNMSIILKEFFTIKIHTEAWAEADAWAGAWPRLARFLRGEIKQNSQCVEWVHSSHIQESPTWTMCLDHPLHKIAHIKKTSLLIWSNIYTLWWVCLVWGVLFRFSRPELIFHVIGAPNGDHGPQWRHVVFGDVWGWERVRSHMPIWVTIVAEKKVWCRWHSLKKHRCYWFIRFLYPSIFLYPFIA